MTDEMHDVETGPLIGTWRNTNAATGQIAGLRIEAIDGRPSLHAWGAARPSGRDWGRVPIGRLYRGAATSPAAAAFEAQFEFGPMTTVLEANVSKGLLIVACMKTFRDGSGRSDYFVREFFHRSNGSPPAGLVPADRGARPVTCADDERVADRPAAGPDPALFLGRWENTDAMARGFREVRIGGGDGGMRLEIGYADGSRAECVAQPFAEHAASPAATQFRAALDRRGPELRMHGWVKLGVMVIAVFRHPAGSAPLFDREFFFLAERP